MKNKIIKKITDWIFPPRCPVCDGLLDEFDSGIHTKCLKALIPAGENVCVHCGRPLPSENGEYCGQCRKNQPAFTQGKGIYLYQGAVKQSMYRFKYSNRREYAGFFAETAAGQYTEWIRKRKMDCIVPVPMYKSKKNRRGYNQAETFARQLAAEVGIPEENRLLFRVRNTQPLKLMNEQERQRELKEAFIADGELIAQYNYRNILIADDIFTTGSTANAAASAIMAAAREKEKRVNVYILTVCISSGI